MRLWIARPVWWRQHNRAGPSLRRVAGNDLDCYWPEAFPTVLELLPCDRACPKQSRRRSGDELVHRRAVLNSRRTLVEPWIRRGPWWSGREPRRLHRLEEGGGLE